MSYNSEAQVVRVADADRQAARESLESLMGEAAKLAAIISRTLGRDAVDISRGFCLSFNADKPPVDVPGLGIGVAIMCNPQTGECIGVMDDFHGVSRPCSPAEANLCLQCSVAPTDPVFLSE